MKLEVLLSKRKEIAYTLETERSLHITANDTLVKFPMELTGGNRMTRINSNMKRWIEQAIVDEPEPFTAKVIHQKVIDMRAKNTHFITNAWSVGFYLNQICDTERIGKENKYWRKQSEN